MPESAWSLVFLGILTLCVVALTALMVSVAQGMHRVFGELQGLIPRWEGTLRQARETLGIARRLLIRADRTGQQVEGVFHRACRTASNVVDQIEWMKEKVGSFLEKPRFGNGVKPAQPASRPASSRHPHRRE